MNMNGFAFRPESTNAPKWWVRKRWCQRHEMSLNIIIYPKNTFHPHGLSVVAFVSQPRRYLWVPRSSFRINACVCVCATTVCVSASLPWQFNKIADRTKRIPRRRRYTAYRKTHSHVRRTVYVHSYSKVFVRLHIKWSNIVLYIRIQDTECATQWDDSMLARTDLAKTIQAISRIFGERAA